MASIPVALQLYTVRDDCARDFIGTLKRVAAIGYAGVELAGLHGMSARDLAAVLKGLGLRVAGMHTGIDALSKELGSTLADAHALSCPYLVCAYMPEEFRKTAADWQAIARRMSHIGQSCKAEGLGLCYHNHSFEFQQFDGQYGLDLFFRTADPGLVKAEVDVYWVQHGGEDPVRYMHKYTRRLPLVYLKDMADEPDRSFNEVGEGTVDIAAVIAEAESGRSEWLIVQQDTCKRPPLESARISFDNLRKRGKA